MSEIITRRRLIAAGFTAAGAAGLSVAARLADRYGLIPPDHSHVFGSGETATYAALRLFTSHHSFAREFSRSDISKVAPVKGEPPQSETYRRLLAGGFTDWRLKIDGLVARPSSLSLAELKRLPSESHIYHQACEEGWSFIAEWIGVRLSYVLNLVGVRPQAKYIVFFGFDALPDAGNLQAVGAKWNSIAMDDAWHPQTLLSYGMNRQDLPTRHGAPLRLRVPRQLGGKSTKYLSHILATDTVSNIGKGHGAPGPEHGFAWYMGI